MWEVSGRPNNSRCFPKEQHGLPAVIGIFAAVIPAVLLLLFLAKIAKKQHGTAAAFRPN
jgi:hypothetical protein